MTRPTIPISLTLMILVLTVALSSSLLLAADNLPPRPCSQPEASQFDFWIGNWNLTWQDSLTGTNVITKDLDGCVIRENFSSNDTLPFRGMSISVFNQAIGKWQQTWVDNQGGYLDFVGEFRDGKMTLGREARPLGKPPFLQRMIWYDIQQDSFMWNWERSDDSGKTWKQLWVIRYTRK